MIHPKETTFTIDYLHLPSWLPDGSKISKYILRKYLENISLEISNHPSHPQIRAERRRHLGTCEHDRGQTLGLNSEGEARGSLPWTMGMIWIEKWGGFMEFP